MFARLTRSPDNWRWALVVVGVALRLAHFLRAPALWHDEAALVLNVIGLKFSECFGKLLHHEAAPPLFLVLEKLVADALGDSELALRAPVLIVGCLSLVLFAWAAPRILTPWWATIAVGLFAFSDRLIWHATEAKPYAIDVLVAVVVIAGYIRTRFLPLRFQCMIWLLVLPIAEWLSFPVCFMAGGLLLALVPAVVRANWFGQFAYLILGLVVVSTFVALALGPAKAQQDGAMTGCWVNQFADWNRPLWIPVWAAASTAEVLRYALMPIGQLLLPLAIVGVVRLGKRDGRLLVVLLMPLALSLIAALMGKYPYGGVRVSVFAAPALILCVAEGTMPTWNWLRQRSQFLPAIIVVALALPIGLTLFRAVVPWPRIDFRDSTSFARERILDGDLIATDHWEALYYLRDQGDHVCDPSVIAKRRPQRVWVLTGTDPGVGDSHMAKVPADWQRIDSRVFPGTIAVLFEHRPRPVASTSAGPAIP